MRVVRPFDPDTVAIGEASDWLVGPADDVGVSIRIRRGGADRPAEATLNVERFALVLEGQARVVGDGEAASAAPGELIFVPEGRSAVIAGDEATTWVEIEAPVVERRERAGTEAERVIPIDPAKFEGTGFAYQPLIDRASGSDTMRMNVLRVAPGAGSPDYHIHTFAQIYVIQEGEMSLDVGSRRVKAGKNSVVFLPAGLVHRNFNASAAVERHVSLLVPEPKEGEIFDFAVTIHPEEAQLLTELPV